MNAITLAAHAEPVAKPSRNLATGDRRSYIWEAH